MAATLPLLVSALKPHSSHFSLFFAGARNSWLCLFKPPPERHQANQRLQEFWALVGCAVMQCSNTEVGAGTMNPLTYLRVLGPEPWNVVMWSLVSVWMIVITEKTQIGSNVCVENLCKKQTANEVEVRGPPVSKAFDQQGNPTKAAEGFCRRYDVPLDSLFMKVDGKTEYIYAKKWSLLDLLWRFCLRMCLVSLLRYHSQSQCAGTLR
ncbi:hypothetical protein ACOSQ2_003824 [Xanthoceras sorbifolium]